MDTVDSQILDGGPPQRLIDPPIFAGTNAGLAHRSCFLVMLLSCPAVSTGKYIHMFESSFWIHLISQ
jgi:hypothetical protein